MFFSVNILFSSYLMTLEMVDKDEDYIFSRCIDSYFTLDDYIYYVKTADGETYRKKFIDIRRYYIENGFILVDDVACVHASETDVLFINIENVSIFFGSILTFISFMWGIKKAIGLLK
jgi:hypothetical protein